jgi:hypothetical protein
MGKQSFVLDRMEIAMIAVLNRLTLQLALGAAFGVGQLILAVVASPMPFANRAPSFSRRSSQPPPRSRRPSALAGVDPQNSKGSDYDIPYCPRGAVPGSACRHCHRVSEAVFRSVGSDRGIPSEPRFITPMLLPRTEPVECVAIGIFMRI